MARPIIYLWLPGLTALALFSACGGVSDPGLFSTSGGASAAGNTSTGGQSALSGAAGDDAGGSDGGSSAAGSHSAGSGGATHAGGSAGTAAGGSVGHAGASGTAGAGTSGGAGSGGGSAGSAGGGGELTCNELFTQAGQQLEAARACNIAQDITQCTGKVTSPCNCEVPVEREDSAETKAYLATLKQLDKKKCALLCPASVCLPANHAQCSAPASGIIGVCTASLAVTQ